MTQDNRFFGYGSLVNKDTHHRPLDYKPIRLSGWRRSWGYRIDEYGAKDSGCNKIVTLTVSPCSTTQLDGLLVNVDPVDWDVLDEREFGYDRLAIDEGFIYSAQADKRGDATDGYFILQSYVDAVCQGYLRVFGEEGLKHFIDTTDGWHGDIRPDRDNPLYPRPVVLTGDEQELIDDMLAQARK